MDPFAFMFMIVIVIIIMILMQMCVVVLVVIVFILVVPVSFRQTAIVRRSVIVQRQANLTHSAGALDASGCRSRLLHGRQEQGDQHANDRNHNEQFNECEAFAIRLGRMTLGTITQGRGRGGLPASPSTVLS